MKDRIKVIDEAMTFLTFCDEYPKKERLTRAMKLHSKLIEYGKDEIAEHFNNKFNIVDEQLF